MTSPARACLSHEGSVWISDSVSCSYIDRRRRVTSRRLEPFPSLASLRHGVRRRPHDRGAARHRGADRPGGLQPDFLLLGALLVLAVAGVLTPVQVLAGFSNPAIATIAGLFLVAAGIRATGLIDRVAQAMFGEGASLRSVLARITTLSG